MLASPYITALKFVAAVVSFLAWYKTSDLVASVFLWLMILAILVSFKRYDIGMLLVIAGVTCNAVVVLLNNGVMPVVAMPTSIYPLSPIWVRAVPSNHALFLADHMSLWRFSIGDLLCLAGFIALVCRFVGRKGGFRCGGLFGKKKMARISQSMR